MSFLIGNSFPMGLIRREVKIRPQTHADLKAALSTGEWESFWGHTNTLGAVQTLLGEDLTPREERPVLKINSHGYPELYGKEYHVCWILTAEYKPGFRPPVNQEVKAEEIVCWNVLKMEWV